MRNGRSSSLKPSPLEPGSTTHNIPPAERATLQQTTPPNGEWYPDIAARLTDWLAELNPARPALVISQGITAGVLRGILVGGEDWHGVPVAPRAPQGTVFRIVGGVEQVIHTGTGAAVSRAA